MKKILSLILIATISVCAFAKQEQNPKIFKQNDNVCFVGDSITHGAHYINNIVLFYVTRFPQTKLSFYNFGISGDSCNGILARMQDDIKPVKADIYTLMIGMNDVGRGKFSDANRVKPDHQKNVLSTRNFYQKNMEKLSKILAENSRKLVIFTPSIYDQNSENKTENLKGVNDELKVYGEIGGKLAKQYNGIVVDMWGAMENVNNALHKTDIKKSIIGGDRVHPGDVGGYVMATQFVRDLNESKMVSKISIDANTPKVLQTFNADINSIGLDGEKISFKALEAALPYPTDKAKDEIDEIVKFLPEYNRQILQVKNLKADKYILNIDGKKCGEYTAKELSEGVNLALNKQTPQYAQAKEVAKLCSEFRKKTDIYRQIRATEYFLKLRKFKSDKEMINAAKEAVEKAKDKGGYVMMLAKRYPDLKPKQKEMAKDLLVLLDKCYQCAQTKEHSFELSPLK